jgi:hypothetical protein
MIVLADNDIVHKLACCELLPELLLWLKAPPTQVWVLPTLHFWIRRKLKTDPLAATCFEKFMTQVQAIPAAQPATLERLAQLDVGERQMLAVLVDNTKITQMVTGDKRALKQIGELASSDQALTARLDATRIDCLESIMLGLIDQFGFAAINAKATRGATADGVLGMSFGAKRSQAHTVEALTSYLDGVRASAAFVAKK